MSMKSFCEAETSLIRGLPISRASRVVANAIPRFLPRTMYERVLAIRTYLRGHGNWSCVGCPDDDSWEAGTTSTTITNTTAT